MLHDAVDDERRASAVCVCVCVYSLGGRGREEKWMRNTTTTRTRTTTTKTTTTDDNAGSFARRRLVLRVCVCLSLFSSSLGGSVSDGDWRKSNAFVCSPSMTRFEFFFTPPRNECVYVMCASAHWRLLVGVALFCVDRVTRRVCLWEVNERRRRNNKTTSEEKNSEKKKNDEKENEFEPGETYFHPTGLCVLLDVQAFIALGKENSLHSLVSYDSEKSTIPGIVHSSGRSISVRNESLFRLTDSHLLSCLNKLPLPTPISSPTVKLERLWSLILWSTLWHAMFNFSSNSICICDMQVGLREERRDCDLVRSVSQSILTCTPITSREVGDWKCCYPTVEVRLVERVVRKRTDIWTMGKPLRSARKVNRWHSSADPRRDTPLVSDHV